jgi:hypothetical protein
VRIVALVHLVWAPLGVGPLERFLEAFELHPPGVPHRLHVVLNGFADDASLAGHRALLRDVLHDEQVLGRREHDLGAYRAAASCSSAPVLAFTNSYAQPLADEWLAALDEQLQDPGVGLVGATGSHESALSEAPRPLRPLRAAVFPLFPNPHVRTNAFALERSVFERLAWPRPRTKAAALRLESGRRSLTRQVAGMGLRTLVVGRDGRAYEPPDWPISRTFRSGDQENLLVADNRTAQYADAAAAERRRLAAMAWGAEAAV